MNLLFAIQGHNRYFTLFGLFVGGSSATAMGILYTLGIMYVEGCSNILVINIFTTVDE